MAFELSLSANLDKYKSDLAEARRLYEQFKSGVEKDPVQIGANAGSTTQKPGSFSGGPAALSPTNANAPKAPSAPYLAPPAPSPSTPAAPAAGKAGGLGAGAFSSPESFLKGVGNAAGIASPVVATLAVMKIAADVAQGMEEKKIEALQTENSFVGRMKARRLEMEGSALAQLPVMKQGIQFFESVNGDKSEEQWWENRQRTEDILSRRNLDVRSMRDDSKIDSMGVNRHTKRVEKTLTDYEKRKREDTEKDRVAERALPPLKDNEIAIKDAYVKMRMEGKVKEADERLRNSTSTKQYLDIVQHGDFEEQKRQREIETLKQHRNDQANAGDDFRQELENRRAANLEQKMANEYKPVQGHVARILAEQKTEKTLYERAVERSGTDAPRDAAILLEKTKAREEEVKGMIKDEQERYLMGKPTAFNPMAESVQQFVDPRVEDFAKKTEALTKALEDLQKQIADLKPKAGEL